jgi:NADH pyrophosphatase NudC (nudix superfamily)
LREDFDCTWETLSQEVTQAMKQWRLQHPQATLSDIEEAVDQQLGKMRARTLEDLALASQAADLRNELPSPPPLCSHCGTPMQSRGKKKRRLKTHHGQGLNLERSYAVCSTCGVGFFPPR